MPVITLDEAQQWLEETRFPLNALDNDLELSARTLAFSTVSNVYATTGWTDESTTPQLMREVVSMLYASYVYDKAFSEDFPDGSGYATRLYDRAMTVLMGIVNGTIDIAEVATAPIGQSGPLFWPNDTTVDYDSNGREINISRKFSMGQVF